MLRRLAFQIVASIVGFLSVSNVQAWGADFPLSVFVVRHAEKAALPTDDPGLSEKGERRALALARLLQDAGIKTIYASEAARTQLTVKPLAELLHLEINHEFPAANREDLARAILNGHDRAVLVAGHSNTVPDLIRRLGGGSVPPIQDAWEFDNLYVVTIYAPNRASTLRLHYGEPSISLEESAGQAKWSARIMHIVIATSGGFAAIPGMAMQAKVDLSGDSGRVTQTESGYTRNLTVQEAQEVRGMVEPTRFFELPEELRPLNESGLRSSRASSADQRQFDITIRLEDGREHTVRVSEQMTTDLDRLSSGLGRLLEWAKEEFDRIMTYKIQHR